MSPSDPSAAPAPDFAQAPAGRWVEDPEHRAWLEQGFARALAFARPSIRPEGGFHYQGADGRPLPDRPPQLFLTARMAHVAALGVRRGLAGAEELLDHAVASLLGYHADPAYGGWLTDPSVAPGKLGVKAAYEHAHVGLAAAAALEVSHPQAQVLFGQVAEVIEERFWDPATQTLRESFARDWSTEEAYRGANANMHGLEAFLALGDATGDATWHRRGLAVANRLCHRAARAQGWLLPEHFSADWTPLPGYNRDEPDHPFRPYGATLGHSLEWARFLLDLHGSALLSAAEKPAWLVEAAEALTRRALDGGWGCDGRDGLPYTVDWDGTVVSPLRLHWPVCEGIQASAQLGAITGDAHWEGWYRRLWTFSRRVFIDDHGAWINEIDAQERPAGTVWPGRPDVYHAAGALLGPLRTQRP